MKVACEISHFYVLVWLRNSGAHAVPARARHFAFETSITESLLRQIRGEGPVAVRFHLSLSSPPSSIDNHHSNTASLFEGLNRARVVMRVSASRMSSRCDGSVAGQAWRTTGAEIVSTDNRSAAVDDRHGHRAPIPRGPLTGLAKNKPCHYHGTKGPPPGRDRRLLGADDLGIRADPTGLVWAAITAYSSIAAHNPTPVSRDASLKSAFFAKKFH